MKTYRITTYREAGFWGFRIYSGTRKVAGIIARHETEAAALHEANMELAFLRKQV